MFSNGGVKVQSFGGPWPLLKLDVLEKYLNFFMKAMKNQNFKLCYIDAFAGSGDLDVPGIGSIPDYWRGVIFLDPYAMNLNWDSLSSIAKTKAFDVWYLFPLSAVNRVLPRHGNIPESHRQKLHQVLGTTSWEREIYQESPQLTLLTPMALFIGTINGILSHSAISGMKFVALGLIE